MQGVKEETDLEQEAGKVISKPRQINKEIEQMLSLRRTLKSNKPKFIREESWRYKRVKPAWRKPNGIDSKMRLKKRGWPKSVETGYRSPKQVRHLHPSGFREVLVHNVKDLEEVQSTQAIRIAHTVGRKKRIEIIEKAEELKIFVLNKRGRDVETY